MTVRVIFFAYLRERLGVREIRVELAPGAVVEDLRDELHRRYDLRGVERLRLAVNRAYVDEGHSLHDEDEVALIPPVSGGASQRVARGPSPCCGAGKRLQRTGGAGGASAGRKADFQGRNDALLRDGIFW
jgi:molybdopterin converting factor subunit 1